MSASKVKVLKTDKVYLSKDKIDINIYSDDIQEMISSTEFEKYKFCNCCGNYYPLHSNFFMNEKRQKDGYENKCRLCRKGKFIKDSERLEIFYIDKNESVIINYINFLNSNAIKISNTNFLKENIKEILDYLIKDMTDDEVYNISRDWIKNNKLYGLSIHTYNGSIANMFVELYGDRFKPWLFFTAGKRYWESEQNKTYAFKWFVNKIIDDSIVESENDLNTISLNKLMNQYKLGGLFNYFGNSFNVLNYYYPNKFKDYEMNILTDINKDMVRDCIRNYVLNTLMIPLNKIKYHISFNEIMNAKDRYVVKIYRNAMLNNLFDNINDMIEYCFSELDIKEYKRCNHKNYYRCYDGKIAKSSEERQLYYILKNNGLKVELCSEYDNKYLMYDSINSNRIYPDFWIYKDDIIVVVEYYGYINKGGTFANDIGYTSKHDKKVDYYTNRLDRNKYSYIGVYPDDLKKDNSKGLIDKFDSICIKLIV